MKVSWPFGVALRREASSRLMLRWLKTVVVSDEEKAPVEASGGDREGERERIVADVARRVASFMYPGCHGGGQGRPAWTNSGGPARVPVFSFGLDGPEASRDAPWRRARTTGKITRRCRRTGMA